MVTPYNPFTDVQKEQLRSGLVGDELAQLDKLINYNLPYQRDPRTGAILNYYDPEKSTEYYNQRFAGRNWGELEQSVGSLLNTPDLSTLTPAQRLDLAAYMTPFAEKDRNRKVPKQDYNLDELFATRWGDNLKPSRPVDYEAMVRGQEFNSDTLAKLSPLLLSPGVYDPNKFSLQPYFSYSPYESYYQNAYGTTPSLTSYRGEKNPAIDWQEVSKAIKDSGITGPVNFGAGRVAGVDANGRQTYTPWTRDDVNSWVWGILGDESILDSIAKNSLNKDKDIGRYINALDNLAKDIWAEQQERSKRFDPTDLRSVVPLGTDQRYLDPYTFDPTQGNWADKWGKQAILGLVAAVGGGAFGSWLGGLGQAAPVGTTAGAAGGSTGGTAVGGGGGGIAAGTVGPVTPGLVNAGIGSSAAQSVGSTLGGLAGKAGAGAIPSLVVTAPVVGAGSTAGAAAGAGLGGVIAGSGNTGPIQIPDQKPAIDEILKNPPSVKLPEPWYAPIVAGGEKLLDAYQTYNQIGGLLGAGAMEGISGGAVPMAGGASGGGSAGPPLSYDPSIMAMILRNVQAQQEAARPKPLQTETVSERR